MKFLNRFWWWCRFEVKHLPSTVYRGVVNLIVWFKVIWNDVDWDYTSTYEVLEFKLTKQANYIEKYGIHVGKDNAVKNIRTCVDILSKLRTEWYIDELIKYQNRDFKFENNTIVLIKTDDKLDEYFTKYPKEYKEAVRLITEKKPHRLEDRELIAMYMLEIIQKKAKNKLYQILNKHMESWWD